MFAWRLHWATSRLNKTSKLTKKHCNKAIFSCHTPFRPKYGYKQSPIKVKWSPDQPAPSPRSCPASSVCSRKSRNEYLKSVDSHFDRIHFGKNKIVLDTVFLWVQVSDILSFSKSCLIPIYCPCSILPMTCHYSMTWPNVPCAKLPIQWL